MKGWKGERVEGWKGGRSRPDICWYLVLDKSEWSACPNSWKRVTTSWWARQTGPSARVPKLHTGRTENRPVRKKKERKKTYRSEGRNERKNKNIPVGKKERRKNIYRSERKKERKYTGRKERKYIYIPVRKKERKKKYTRSERKKESKKIYLSSRSVTGT